MFEIKIKSKKRIFLFFIVYFSLVFVAIAPQSMAQAGQSKALEGIWDPAKYIDLDEIKAGMKAYCLTEYGVAGIEKFDLEVVDVVHDFEPGLDVILVNSSDERFIHTGPVAGCSGSPGTAAPSAGSPSPTSTSTCVGCSGRAESSPAPAT